MSAAVKTRKPRAGGGRSALTTTPVDDFLAGRDLAVNMLHHSACSPDGPDQAAALRWYRDGKAQDNFARAFIAQVIADSTRLDGFSAVLSAVLAEEICNAGGVDIALYSTLPMAEFLPGVPGQDGTRVDESNTEDDPAQPSAALRRPDIDEALQTCLEKVQQGL